MLANSISQMMRLEESYMSVRKRQEEEEEEIQVIRVKVHQLIANQKITSKRESENPNL